MPYSKSSIGYMSSCCKDADIVSYYDDCGLYCLASDQTAKELTRCLYDEGAKWEDVFCRGEDEATATGEGKPLASSDARVVDESEQKDAESDKDDNDNDNDDDDDDNKKDSDSAAPGAAANMKGGVSVAGVVIGAMLLSATAFNDMQI